MPSDFSRSVPKAILVGAIVAALLDMIDPILFYGLRGIAPIKIPQSIASSILGREAYSYGVRSVLLGLATHLFLALFWTTLFVLAARFLPFVKRYAIATGLLYGPSSTLSCTVSCFRTRTYTQRPIPHPGFS